MKIYWDKELMKIGIECEDENEFNNALDIINEAFSDYDLIEKHEQS